MFATNELYKGTGVPKKQEAEPGFENLMREALERDVELYFKKRLESLGCLVYKFVSPGNSGVPDRLVIVPGGEVWFVEIKRDTGKLRPLQKVVIGQMERATSNIRVLYGYRDVDDFYELIRGRIK